MEVYSRLPASVANDYDHLKQLLLKWYQLTEGDFRRKFYSGKPSSKDTISQFYIRMGHHLNQWISLLVIDRPFELLRELLLKEHFLFVVLRDLSVFMRQHKPKDDDDVFLTCQRLSLMIVFLQEVREFEGNSHALTKFHRLDQNMVSRRGLRLLFLVLLVVVLASYATRLVLSLVIAMWDMGSRNMSKPQSSRIPPVLGNCAVVMDKTSQVQTC